MGPFPCVSLCFPGAALRARLFHPRFTGVPVQIYGADSFAGKDFLAALDAKLSVNIIGETEDSIEFDLVGVEAPLANALRRILLAEVRRSP